MSHQTYNNSLTAPSRAGVDAEVYTHAGKQMRGSSQSLVHSESMGGLSHKRLDSFDFELPDGDLQKISQSSHNSIESPFDKMSQSIAKPAKAKTRAPVPYTPLPGEQASKKAVRFSETELRNIMKPSSERDRYGAGQTDAVSYQLTPARDELSHRPSDADNTATNHVRRAFKQLKAGFHSLSKGDRVSSNESDRTEDLTTNECVHWSPAREKAGRQRSRAGEHSLMTHRSVPTLDFYRHRFSGLDNPVCELDESHMGRRDLRTQSQPELNHCADAWLRSKYSEEQPWPVSRFVEPEMASEGRFTTYAHNKLHAQRQQRLQQLSWQQNSSAQPEPQFVLRPQQSQRERHSLQRSQALWSDLEGSETWSRDEQPFVFPVASKPQPARYKRRQATQQTSTLSWQRAHLRTSGTGYVGARSRHCNCDSSSASYVPSRSDSHLELLDPQAATYAYNLATGRSQDGQYSVMEEAKSSQINDTTTMADDPAGPAISPMQSGDERSELSNISHCDEELDAGEHN